MRCFIVAILVFFAIGSAFAFESNGPRWQRTIHRGAVPIILHSKVAKDLEASLFGSNAARQGWLGSDLALSFELPRPGTTSKWMWFFGDTMVNKTRGKASGLREGALSQKVGSCNGFETAASSCFMVPQSVATYEPGHGDAKSQIKFAWGTSSLTGDPDVLFKIPLDLQPTQATKALAILDPSCNCALDPKTAVFDCTSMPDQICHALRFLWITSALATKDGTQIIILAISARDGAGRGAKLDNLGWDDGGTVQVIVDNAHLDPSEWRYRMRHVPGTGPATYGTMWNNGMTWGNQNQDGEEWVYIIGTRGGGKHHQSISRDVLARAKMSDLLKFDFGKWSFWSGHRWLNSSSKATTRLGSSFIAPEKGDFVSQETETTVHWLPQLERWIIPMDYMDPIAGKSAVVIFAARNITGPYEKILVETPSEANYSLRTVKGHPELACTTSEFVVSVIDDDHYYPRLWRIDLSSMLPTSS